MFRPTIAAAAAVAATAIPAAATDLAPTLAPAMSVVASQVEDRADVVAACSPGDVLQAASSDVPYVFAVRQTLGAPEEAFLTVYTATWNADGASVRQHTVAIAQTAVSAVDGSLRLTSADPNAQVRAMLLDPSGEVTFSGPAPTAYPVDLPTCADPEAAVAALTSSASFASPGDLSPAPGELRARKLWLEAASDIPGSLVVEACNGWNFDPMDGGLARTGLMGLQVDPYAPAAIAVTVSRFDEDNLFEASFVSVDAATTDLVAVGEYDLELVSANGASGVVQPLDPSDETTTFARLNTPETWRAGFSCDDPAAAVAAFEALREAALSE